MNKKSLVLGALVLTIIVGAFFLVSSRNNDIAQPAEDLSSPQTPSLQEDDYSLSDLEVIVADCQEGFLEHYASGEEIVVEEQVWLDEDVLQVTTRTILNCADEITGGSHEIDGDLLILKHAANLCADGGECVRCLCLSRVHFILRGLQQKDYTIGVAFE